jgi:ribonucleotide reductase beta subunit family protein with ferritin-like domain
MIRSTLHMHRYQYIFTNIQNENDPDVITRAFRSYEDEYNRHRNRLIPVWMVFNWLTIATALVSVLLLLCGFISGLF